MSHHNSEGKFVHIFTNSRTQIGQERTKTPKLVIPGGSFPRCSDYQVCFPYLADILDSSFGVVLCSAWFLQIPLWTAFPMPCPITHPLFQMPPGTLHRVNSISNTQHKIHLYFSFFHWAYFSWLQNNFFFSLEKHRGAVKRTLSQEIKGVTQTEEFQKQHSTLCVPALVKHSAQPQVVTEWLYDHGQIT